MAVVQGYDFDAHDGVIDWDALSASQRSTGMQATEVARAADEIAAAVREKREKGAKVVLAFTSNLISCGLREVFCGMAQRGEMDAVITTAGGVEEDFVKCLGPTILGDFALDGAELRGKGLNRIANMLVPNNNYCAFNEWMEPILAEMHKEQDEQGKQWTPSAMIDRLGKDINNSQSFYNKCHKAGIPVFCPSLTDGSIGDMLFFDSCTTPGLVLDTAGDLFNLAAALEGASSVSVICLGGGLPKHHSMQASRLAGVPMARFVFANTGTQFDGSETGMVEADDKSSGRISAGCKFTRLHAEATIVFPLIMQRVHAALY
eukprot:TRINITY_DN17211_c0_g1_i1.p1 TRINITY_DN17211_c0_g1~~TRINITY_DN17211_c0_g1_i1.p1  ORF type:complete len:318 (+),score=64.94 TRINITY_DN17211_c0_g1_i1:450-1403(+)